MEFKPMREYTHDDFVKLVEGLSEQELLKFSANYGGYPVLFRMALDEKLCHIPFIQTGSAIIVRNENGDILLQQRIDNEKWGLPGGCQELGEDLKVTAQRELYEETNISVELSDLILIDNISGSSRKRTYPNGDIVYNNTSLYLVDVNSNEIVLKANSESIKLEFVNPDYIPTNLHDGDLIQAYIDYRDNQRKIR